MSRRKRLGFLGAGNMAEAIARAAVARGVVAAGELVAGDPAPARREVFAELGIQVAPDNRAVIEQSEQVLLAVKPQALEAIAGDLAAFDREAQVLVSIMAGVRSERIESALGGPARVVRVMPNTPLLVGAGMSAVAEGAHARPGDAALATALLGAAGEVIRVEEAQMDAVTAISGSGPAYLFYLAEAMQQAAEEAGLGAHAELLVRKTLRGAGLLLDESGEAPAELRRRVSSPGGTTEAAIRHLDSAGVREALARAIEAAEARGRELGD